MEFSHAVLSSVPVSGAWYNAYGFNLFFKLTVVICSYKTSQMHNNVVVCLISMVGIVCLK